MMRIMLVVVPTNGMPIEWQIGRVLGMLFTK